MARNRIGLQFEGFKELMGQLDRLGGDLKAPVEEALVESQKYIAGQAHAAMAKHHRTGDTEGAIVEDGVVTWEGSTAGIGIGFDLANGGMPSVFLMYGTPTMAKDTALYNAVYGSRTRKEIAALQETKILDAIKKRMG